MKTNYVKIASYCLGVIMVASSCLKTEELDSVKALREAKANQINADVDNQLIVNRYDSIRFELINALTQSNNAYTIAVNKNNELKLGYQFKNDSATAAYTLAVAKATADYNAAKQVADQAYYAAYRAAQATADVAYQTQLTANYNKQIAVYAATQAAEIAYQEQLAAQYQQNEQSYINQTQNMIAAAKNVMLQTQTTFYQNQSQLFAAMAAAKNDSITNALKNPDLAALYNDYFAYYNGGTLKSGVVIPAANSIFTMKNTILTDRNTLLITNKVAQQNLVKTNADLLVNKLALIRADSLSIVANDELIAVYQNAKNAANYNAAILSINNLMTTAASDVTTKNVAKTQQTETLDELTNIYNIANTALTTANTAIGTNNTAKTTAENAMKNLLLVPYGYTSFDQLQTENNRLSKEVNAKTQEAAAWETQYNASKTKLQDSVLVHNNAKAELDLAQANLDAAIQSGASNINSLRAIRDDKHTLDSIANARYQTALAKYNSVLTSYNTAKAALVTAQTNLKNCADDITDYNLKLADYNKAVGNEAGLIADRDAKKTDMETKLAAKDAQQLVKNAADLAYANALSTYNTYLGGKTNLEALQSTGDAPAKDLSALDASIATLEDANTKFENNIADINLQIARINDGSFKIADEIALLTEKIAYNSNLVAEYEALAIAIKAKIDAL